MTTPDRNSTSRIAEAAAVRPSPRQVAWQQTEFYGFVHFGMNTMTDREWGDGREDPAWFDPDGLDAGQWMDALAAAGMRGVILTAKHHDGFCLWPTRQTRHSVAASSWRGGQGDVVAEVAAAAAERGLKFGIYLSPWDRAEPSYGSGTAYDDFYVAQLTELLTGYGPLFAVWLDGACGEGPNGVRQVYDWDRYYARIRELQPEAAITICGPDARWCGNEAGQTRADEWSVVPASLRTAERIGNGSTPVVNGGRDRQIRSDEADLGSREVLLQTDHPLVWYPAEVDTSIRPGWFHHPAEDGSVRTAEELFTIYRRCVGGNANLLLNVPPNRAGVIADGDVAVLAELGRLIHRLTERDIAQQAEIEFSSAPVARDVILDRSLVSGGWRPEAGDERRRLVLRWPRPVDVGGLVLRELITDGQQIESVRIEGTSADGTVVLLADVGCIGYQRIVDFEPRSVSAIMVTIANHRGPVALSFVSVLVP